jgi:serine/threonine protein kinase
VLVNDPAARRICKLCDFGVSSASESGAAESSRTRTLNAGTPVFMAPEVLGGEHGFAHYDEKVDVFSFGVMMWVLWTGHKDPYEHLAESTIGNHQLQPLVEHIADGGRPLLGGFEGCTGSHGAGKKAAALAVKCWSAQPQERPSFPSVVDDLVGIVEPEAVAVAPSPPGLGERLIDRRLRELREEKANAKLLLEY